MYERILNADVSVGCPKYGVLFTRITMDQREVICFYRDWWETVQNLPNEIQLAAFRAICLYGFDGIVPEDVMVNSLTKFMQNAIDRNDKKVEAIREKRRAAVNARWSRMKANPHPQENTNVYKCIDENTDEYNRTVCNTNDSIINNKYINNKYINIDNNAHTREESEGWGGGTIFDECCEQFTSEAEREYQNIIAKNYGITDLRQAFTEFREILIERNLLSEVKTRQDFAKLFKYKYCIPWQKQQLNKHGIINRQAEFARYISGKLAANGTPEPDISNNY